MIHETLIYVLLVTYKHTSVYGEATYTGFVGTEVQNYIALLIIFFITLIPFLIP